MSSIKCKNKTTKNFRFHEETKNDIKNISKVVGLNHTELIEFGVLFIKDNKDKFKDFVDMNIDKEKEVS